MNTGNHYEFRYNPFTSLDLMYFRAVLVRFHVHERILASVFVGIWEVEKKIALRKHDLRGVM